MITISEQGYLLASFPFEYRRQLAEIPSGRWSTAKGAWIFPRSPFTARALADAGLPLTERCYQTLGPLLEDHKRHKDAARWYTEDPPHPDWWTDRDSEGAPLHPPWWRHQLQALAFACEQPSSLLALGMGAGKSRIAIDLIHGLFEETEWRNQLSVLIVCPKTVIPVWRAQTKLYGGNLSQGVMWAELTKGTTRKKLELLENTQPCKGRACTGPFQHSTVLMTVVNYETVWRAPLGEYILANPPDLVIADECCDAGAQIATPEGSRAIETLRIGDTVMGYDHLTGTLIETLVRHVFCRRTDEPSCSFLPITVRHPVFTVERGYVVAESLDTMDSTVLRLSNDRSKVLRVVRQGAKTSSPRKVLQQKLLGSVAHVKAGICGEARYSPKTGNCAAKHVEITPMSRFSTKVRESLVWRYQSLSKSETGKQGEGICCIGSQRMEKSQWWKWSFSTSSAKSTLGCLGRWMGAGILGALRGIMDTRVSASLQGGHSKPRKDDSYGSGRSESSFKKKTRPEEGCHAEATGMESDSCSKQRSDERPVFNVETGTGNYFVNSILVHNCQRLKAPGGRASQWMARLGKLVPRRLGLSGTPLPHSPLDAYGVFRFLDPGIYGTSYGRFRSRYAIMGGGGTLAGKIVIGYQNQGEFREKFHSITYQARTADLIDLPETQHITIPLTMSPSAMRTYVQMHHDFIADVGSGKVTAANAAVKIMRLQQITSGFLPHVDDDGESTVAELHGSKDDALRGLLEDLPSHEPVVVFARFKHDLAAIHKTAESANRKSLELSGRINQLEEWQKGHSTVLAVQQQAGAEGIDLTRAAYCVYFSVCHSLGLYEQSLARLHRPGQTRRTVYYHLQIKGTVDVQIYRALAEKKSVIDAILDDKSEFAMLHQSGNTQSCGCLQREGRKGR